MPQCQPLQKPVKRIYYSNGINYKYPTKFFNLLTNDKNKPFLVRIFKMDAETHSLMRLSRKVMYNVSNTFFVPTHFWTLTFREESNCTSSNIRKFLNVVNTLRKKKGVKQKSYVWRMEKGKKMGRWHIHLLTNFYICKEYRSIWRKQYGIEKPIRIWSYKKAVNYVLKYMSKPSQATLEFKKYTKRLWGTSRDILPKPKMNYVCTDKMEKIWEQFADLADTYLLFPNLKVQLP